MTLKGMESKKIIKFDKEIEIVKDVADTFSKKGIFTEGITAKTYEISKNLYNTLTLIPEEKEKILNQVKDSTGYNIARIKLEEKDGKYYATISVHNFLAEKVVPKKKKATG